MAQTDEIKTSWVTKWDKREKPWGYEMVWSSFMSGHGKLLFLKKGHRTSLKFNTRKSESLLILSGSVTAHFGDELSIEHPVAHPIKIEELQAGMILNVQSGCPYRLEAINEDAQIIEIGDWLSDKSIRIEDDYGRPCTENA